MLNSWCMATLININLNLQRINPHHFPHSSEQNLGMALSAIWNKSIHSPQGLPPIKLRGSI